MHLINVAQAGPMSEAPPLHTYAENILYFVVSLIGIVAILAIVIAGVMYITAGGDRERVQKAKHALEAGIVGLAIALLALIIVRVVMALA